MGIFVLINQIQILFFFYNRGLFHHPELPILQSGVNIWCTYLVDVIKR